MPSSWKMACTSALIRSPSRKNSRIISSSLVDFRRCAERGKHGAALASGSCERRWRLPASIFDHSIRHREKRGGGCSAAGHASKQAPCAHQDSARQIDGRQLQHRVQPALRVYFPPPLRHLCHAADNNVANLADVAAVAAGTCAPSERSGAGPLGLSKTVGRARRHGQGSLPGAHWAHAHDLVDKVDNASHRRHELAVVQVRAVAAE